MMDDIVKRKMISARSMDPQKSESAQFPGSYYKGASAGDQAAEEKLGDMRLRALMDGGSPEIAQRQQEMQEGISENKEMKNKFDAASKLQDDIMDLAARDPKRAKEMMDRLNMHMSKKK